MKLEKICGFFFFFALRFTATLMYTILLFPFFFIHTVICIMKCLYFFFRGGTYVCDLIVREHIKVTLRRLRFGTLAASLETKHLHTKCHLFLGPLHLFLDIP